MLSVVDIPYIVFRLLKRERNGSTVSPSDINRFLEMAHAEEVYAMKSLMEANQDVTDGMRTFINVENQSATAGVVNLSALSGTYLKLLGAQRKNGTRSEDCDVVTQLEWQDREYNSITAPTVDYPICYVRGSTINFRPFPEDGANGVRISYLRHPLVPKVDAYINLQGEIVWLGVGSTVADSLIDTDFLSYGWDGTALTIVNNTYTSTTVEFEWPDEMNRVNIMKRVLVMCGVSAPDQLAILYGAQ